MKHNTITKRLLVLLESHPLGIASTDAAKTLGVTSKAVCKVANDLRDKGEIAAFRQRPASLLVLSEHAAAARVHLSEERQRNNEQKRAERAERDRLRTPRRAFDRHEAWSDRAPIHRVIEAHKARPLGKVGPASVFEVAA
jgi:hypothetical protein